MIHRKIASLRVYLRDDETYADYTLFDCVFGVPLFHEHLNKVICQRIKESELLDPKKLFFFLVFVLDHILSKQKILFLPFYKFFIKNVFLSFSSSVVEFANRDLVQSLRELINKYQTWGEEVSEVF